MEQAIKEHPTIAPLDNFLVAACRNAGLTSRANTLVVEHYKKRPDYLFAKLNYAEFLMTQDRLDEVPHVFGGCFDLGTLYPTRMQPFRRDCRSERAGDARRARSMLRCGLVSSITPWRPNPEQLEAARAKTLPDLVRPGLAVLFCGINPSLYSAAVGRHFARPGNRFWPAMFAAGFVDRRLSAFEQEELLERGYGITNIADRPTASADELTRPEVVEGGRRLREKVLALEPRILALLGLTAYRLASGKPKAAIGEQGERIGGTRVWILPNPSGLNAHYQLAKLAELYASLREACTRSR